MEVDHIPLLVLVQNSSQKQYSVLSFRVSISLASVSLRLCSDKNVFVDLPFDLFYQYDFVVASSYLVAEVSSRHSSLSFLCGPEEETEDHFL